MRPEPTDLRFADALLELLRDSDEYTTAIGTPNLAAFARDLNEVSYETLRRILARERDVTPAILEDVARALRIDPSYFAEYRLWVVQREFDVREVGFERALENLRSWAERGD